MNTKHGRQPSETASLRIRSYKITPSFYFSKIRADSHLHQLTKIDICKLLSTMCKYPALLNSSRPQECWIQFLMPSHLLVQQSVSAFLQPQSPNYSPWNQGLLQCNMRWQTPCWLAPALSFLWPAAIISPAVQEGMSTCSHRGAHQPEVRQLREAGSQHLFGFPPRMAFDQPTSLNWLANELQCLCKTATRTQGTLSCTGKPHVLLASSGP